MRPKRARILLVDDNHRVRLYVKPVLEEAGFECLEAENGEAALELLDNESPDLIVLDILLPDMSGLDVCKEIRERDIRIPVIFLTVKDRMDDLSFMMSAFRVGGTEYVTKRDELKRLEQSMGMRPTELIERKSDMAELIVKINAALGNSVQEFDDYLRVDMRGQQAYVRRREAWEEVRLARKEFLLLESLIKSAGRPVGKNRLMDVAEIDGEASLQTHIWKLRQKLEPDPQNPRYIVVYHGIGYRFRNPDQ